MDNVNITTVDGTVESVTYQNTENGFTVLEFNTSDGDYIVARGLVGNTFPGEKLTLYGEWQVHPVYGKQFKVDSCTRSIPETADEMLSFLASGLIKGVKERTAQKIVEMFGDKTFEVIEFEPERLARIKGISGERAREISKAFCKLAAERNAIITLEKYGFTTAEALKVFKVFGSRSGETVERNPYLLCNEITGIDFDRVCVIASNLPKKPLDEYRIREGIVYVIKHNLSNGHTCVPRESLIEPCISLMECTEDEVEINIDFLIESKRIISDNLYNRDFIFLPELYEAEKSAAQMILFIRKYAGKAFPDIDEEIKRTEIISGVCYNEKQRQAIKLAVEKGILILTGGPGTGKTTTLRGILRVFQSLGLEVALAAPTGRAAKRMTELTGEDATTIHRLLEVEWDEDDKSRFKRNKRNPLNVQAVIVDELSMVDVQLFSSLLDALPLGCRLIMVGDSDQLPPVGAGNVLHDLIDSKVLPVVELDEVFRQAMESLIIQNAHRIVAGEMPDLESKDKDFFFMERRTPGTAAVTVCELCEERLPKAYGYSPTEDIQILCPSKKGETGTVMLNQRLQQKLNPPDAGKKEHVFGSRIMRVGDKVMQTKNNYDILWKSEKEGTDDGKGIFNGDIGVIEDIDNEEKVLVVRFDDRKAYIPFDNASDIEHAYAVTVHKSQGNEFPAVVIPVAGITPMLQYRNLLYTAVTRAKDLIVLVGSRDTVDSMVQNNRKQKRYSALKYFVITSVL